MTTHQPHDPEMEPSFPQPAPDADSAGFWEAAQQGHLALRRCQECGVWEHPPLERCRACGGRMEYVKVSGDAHLCSFAVVHRAPTPAYGPYTPYILGVAELVEQAGLRLTTRLVDMDPAHLRIGQPLRAKIVDHPGGQYRIPVFAPGGTKEPMSAGS